MVVIGEVPSLNKVGRFPARVVEAELCNLSVVSCVMSSCRVSSEKWEIGR